MLQDDKAAAERLNTAWDSALAGRPDPLNGLDSDLADRVRAVQSHAAPQPDPTFIAKLDSSLRRVQEQKHWSSTGQLPASPLGQTLPLRILPVKQAVAAAVILLASIVGTISLVFDDDRDEPQAVQLAAATAATPSTVNFTVTVPSDSRPTSPIRFDECDVSPLTVADVIEASPHVWSARDSTIDVRLGGSSDSRKPRVVIGLPNGAEASATQLAGIEATLRELSACRFYNTAETGPAGRLFALFTESYRENLTRSPGGHVAFPWLPNPTNPASVQLTRQLPDGRVLAVLVSEVSYLPGNFDVLVVVFSQRGERWLVDELRDVAYWGPAGPQWEQERGIIELVFTDQEPGYQPINSSPVLVDGWSYTLVLYNPGATERGFKSEGLGIDVTVPPHETRTVEFTPLAGEFTFVTRTGNQVDEAAPPPCEGMPYPDNTMVVYAEPPLNDPWSCGKG